MASASGGSPVLRSDCQQISAHPSERNAAWMSARLSYRIRGVIRAHAISRSLTAGRDGSPIPRARARAE